MERYLILSTIENMKITLIAKLEDVMAAFKIKIIIATILNRSVEEETLEMIFL